MKTRTRINFDNRLFNNRLTYHLFIHQRGGTIVTGQNACRCVTYRRTNICYIHVHNTSSRHKIHVE